jgi:hypothetical protein
MYSLKFKTNSYIIHGFSIDTFQRSARFIAIASHPGTFEVSDFNFKAVNDTHMAVKVVSNIKTNLLVIL